MLITSRSFGREISGFSPCQHPLIRHLTPSPRRITNARIVPTLMRLFSALLACLLVVPALRAEPLPLDHECATLVKKYLTAVVEQDWKVAADMLVTDSLDRRQRETVGIIKSAPTMSDEATMLQGYNVKDYKELEKMSPQEFYVADRNAWHQKLKIAPETTKRKKETLNIKILAVCHEPEKNYVHVTVRTSQETLTDKIEELFLISFVPNPKNPKGWLIAPEMKDRPVITPLAGSDAKK